MRNGSRSRNRRGDVIRLRRVASPEATAFLRMVAVAVASGEAILRERTGKGGSSPCPTAKANTVAMETSGTMERKGCFVLLHKIGIPCPKTFQIETSLKRPNWRGFFVFFAKKFLTFVEVCVTIFERESEIALRTAMMQEIARKRGNFCGVCPVIGRLNCSQSQRISLRHGTRVGLASAIFHGPE